MTVYYSPEAFGLKIVGEIEFSSGSYEFDLTVVWKTPTGGFVYADDSGCSCPAPFDGIGMNDLLPIVSLSEFQQHLQQRAKDRYAEEPEHQVEIVKLIERLHGAGLR